MSKHIHITRGYKPKGKPLGHPATMKPARRRKLVKRNPIGPLYGPLSKGVVRWLRERHSEWLAGQEDPHA